MQGRTPDLNKGLIFLYQQDLIVTGNFWNVVVNLDLNWYRSQLEVIDLILHHIDTYQKGSRTQNTSPYINWQEINYLHAVWDQLNLELMDLEKLLPTARRKEDL